ncbi:MAG: hypothetical protein HC767_09490 [Akkermansiaceae bacterium]|nr:hypothetical protein [Akkermansiaceae bacterium]
MIRRPSSLANKIGKPESTTPTAELVVPKSIPKIISAISASFTATTHAVNICKQVFSAAYEEFLTPSAELRTFCTFRQNLSTANAEQSRNELLFVGAAVFKSLDGKAQSWPSGSSNSQNQPQRPQPTRNEEMDLIRNCSGPQRCLIETKEDHDSAPSSATTWRNEIAQGRAKRQPWDWNWKIFPSPERAE